MKLVGSQTYTFLNGKTYFCINGAYHTYRCCKTCWNGHPANKPGKDFRVDCADTLNKLVFRDAVKQAMKSGFTRKQAEYLVEKVIKLPSPFTFDVKNKEEK